MSQEAWNRVDGAVRRRSKEDFSNRCNTQAYLLFYTKSMDTSSYIEVCLCIILQWNVVFISSYHQKGTKIFKTIKGTEMSNGNRISQGQTRQFTLYLTTSHPHP
jgi:hypothetical protein